jgi:diacylglycerol O-acyltransferase
MENGSAGSSQDVSPRLVQVPGASSQFIFQEADRVPGHTLKIVILGPAPDGEPVSFETVRNFVSERMAPLAPFCWTAVNAPMKIGHPFFVATDLDLSYHLQRATARQPGGDHELAAVISEATVGSLDVGRPLWRVWYVDGLAGGRRALIIKMHHALADGGASARLIERLFDESRPVPPAPDALPVRRLELLRVALAERVSSLLRLPLLILASLATFLRRTVKLAKGAEKTAKPFEAPPMPYNDALTRRRAFAYTHVDLTDVKAVRKAFGVSFNAVYMALCAASARNYAASIGADPTRSLTASVPIAIGDDDHLWGNHLSTWYVTVSTDVADPVERLLLIDKNAAAARVNYELGDRDLQERWMQHWRLWSVPTFQLPKVTSQTSAPPSFNYICSNVKGPAGGSLAGAQMVDLLSVGPLVHGIGLNFTAWSFGDRLAVSVLVCPDHVADVWEFADHVAVAMQELLDAI